MLQELAFLRALSLQHKRCLMKKPRARSSFSPAPCMLRQGKGMSWVEEASGPRQGQVAALTRALVIGGRFHLKSKAVPKNAGAVSRAEVSPLDLTSQT